MVLGHGAVSLSQRLYIISNHHLYGTVNFLSVARRCGIATSRPGRFRTMASTSRRVDPFSVGDILYGSSGRRYTVDEILSDRRKPLRCVYRAWYVGAPDMVTQTQTFRGLKANKSYVESAQGERYIVKNILQGDFEYQQELQKPLSVVPNVRTVIDTICDGELFVYRYLAGDLLHFAQRPLSDALRKEILRSALVGLAELHDRHIIHSGE